MKFFFALLYLLYLSGCSLNSNSKYWTEENNNNSLIKSNSIQEKFNDKNLTSLSIEEFEIYIENYAKNNPYPNIDE